jgi:hypothetical protein
VLTCGAVSAAGLDCVELALLLALDPRCPEWTDAGEELSTFNVESGLLYGTAE